MDDIKFVQQRLWSNGHKVKRMPACLGFNLMVDGKIKVKVVNISEHTNTFSGFDILAYVENEIDGGKKVFYRIGKSNYSKSFKSISKGGGNHGKEEKK